MKIRLADRTSMWGLKESEVFLTFANPGPIDLDWESLSETQKMALRNALISQKILRVDSEEIPELDKKQVASTPPISEEKKTRKKREQSPASKLVAKKMSEIKLELAKMTLDDLPTIEKAIELEKKKKKSRPGVIKLLKAAIANITSHDDDEQFEITEETTDVAVQINLARGEAARKEL